MKLNVVFSGLDNWIEGTKDYIRLVMDRLFTIMVEEAPKVEQWMRDNSLWQDECMPGKEYLRAVPYRDDDRMVVGIVAFYDSQLRNEHCPDQDVEFDITIAHEFSDYEEAGVIAILNPNIAGAVTVFDEPFPDVIGRVIAEFAG